MKKIAASALAITLAAGSIANAGGVAPVVIEDAPVLVEDSGSSSFGSMSPAAVVGALLVVGIIAAIASSDDDSSSSTTPRT